MQLFRLSYGVDMIPYNLHGANYELILAKKYLTVITSIISLAPSTSLYLYIEVFNQAPMFRYCYVHAAKASLLKSRKTRIYPNFT
ncbi:hypothetical protein CAL7102_06742 [Dulcicalothrix desertica PCC 7102]|nr:hypothetical protein CAL7102_06742 [Dulcicalothrix desertica PCC 7102]